MAPDSVHAGHYDALIARGIDRSAITAFGIEPHPAYYRDFPYWLYPVSDASGHIVAWRGKAMTKSAPMKYRWWTERQPSAPWAVYIPQTIQTGRAVIVAAGEPDVWLLTTLRIPACTFLNGEGSRPHAAGIGQIVARQPTKCVVIYDNDEAGRRGCVESVRALRQAGLAAEAKTLPDTLPAKGDITDLFAACGQDRARFVEALGALATVDVSDEPAPRRRPAHLAALPTPGPIGAFKERYHVVDIAQQFVELTTHASGRYMTGRCPFHDDRTPSFVVWPEIDKWRCFGCARRGDQIDLVREYKGLTSAMQAVS